MFAPITLSAVGAGLVYTWSVDTSMSRLIGYQILFGVGFGRGIRQTIVAVQAGSKNPHIPSFIAFLCFAQNFGGAVPVSVAQNLWDNKLARNLQDIARINPARVGRTGECRSITCRMSLVCSRQSGLPPVLPCHGHSCVHPPCCVLNLISDFSLLTRNLDLASGILQQDFYRSVPVYRSRSD